jgi:eukaryotic-like serine/threonine-protein kinase
MPKQKYPGHFRLDDLLVQPDRLLFITENGRKNLLEPRLMKVLVALAENAGETLSPDRLLLECWSSDEAYDDNPVQSAISLLRGEIGDNSRTPRYIETIRKQGYRLIASVTWLGDNRSDLRQLDPWTNGNPYVGLRSFDEAHTDVFFGRNRMITELLTAMRSQIENQRRFVLLVGASGCGKTSLLHAGAIPRITGNRSFDGLRALSIAHCNLAEMQAGNAMAVLVSAMATWTVNERPVFPPQTLDQLEKMLVDQPDSIGSFIKEAFNRPREIKLDQQPYAHLLLAIDHAEALVSPSVHSQMLAAFSRVMYALCDSPYALVTMIARSDFYPKLIEALPDLVERKAGNGHLDVLIPLRGEIADIIRKPANLAELKFEADPLHLTRLDDELLQAALVQPDALPLLQHTLQTLYDLKNEKYELTFAAYRMIGELEGAIAHRAEEVFAALPADAQASLDPVLAKLIVVHPESDAVSAHRVEIEAFDNNARNLIDAFINARLFVGDHDNGHRIFGVVHEALLRRWPRAVDWVKDNRRTLQIKAQLKRSADQWKQEGMQDDHLLNPGRPLAEALEILDRHAGDLTSDERIFVDASARAFRGKRRLRRGAIVALVLLTATAIAMATATQIARSKAEDRRAETQEILKHTMQEVVDKIEPSGNIELIESISQQVISHYRKQLISEMQPPDLVIYSKALRVLATVRKYQGRHHESATLYGLSASKARLAIDIDNENNDAWFELSQSVFYLGEIDFLEKRYESADKKWNSYLRITKKFTTKFPSDPKWLLEESYALNNLGSSSLRQGRTDAALDYFQASVALKRRIVKIAPKNLDYRYALIDSRSWIISTLEAKGRLLEASQGYDETIRDLSELLTKKESNVWEHRLANYLMLSASVETKLGNRNKANAAAKASVGKLTLLTQLEPDNSNWAKDLSLGLKILADTHQKSADSTHAAGLASKATGK